MAPIPCCGRLSLVTYGHNAGRPNLARIFHEFSTPLFVAFHWGMKPSLSFVAQPQTNRVAERFNRTMKEQAIYDRNFVTTEGAREAVRDFVERYNKQWLIEKNSFKSPGETRQSWSKGLLAA